MSGYPDDVLTERGVLREGVRLIQKPFRRDDLLHVISETLRSHD